VKDIIENENQLVKIKNYNYNYNYKDLKKKLNNLNHVSFVSDGCAKEFKSKFMQSNLLYSNEDFGVTADWHFSPTSHGKSEADGVGGSCKNNATSKVKSGACEIKNAADFVNCCKTFTEKMTIYEVKEEEILAAKTMLDKRWPNVKAIDGIRNYHYFSPIYDQKKIAAFTSSWKDGEKTFKVIK
jgi:hypothetical protein